MTFLFLPDMAAALVPLFHSYPVGAALFLVLLWMLLRR
jgi:hypothetical protein